MMKLTVLGGSAACPNPGQGSSAYLVEVDGKNILLDCGPNTLLELRKHAELDRVHQIVLSHLHADHTIDLVPFRYGLKYAPGLDPHRIPLYLPPGGLAFLERLANAFAMGAEGADDFFTETFDVREYDPASALSLSGCRVTFHRTNHPVPCWAMRLESPHGTLVYLADTGPQADLSHFARDADLLICEGTFPRYEEVAGIEDRPHISAFEAGEIARHAGVRSLVLTHLWAAVGFDVYQEEAERGFHGPVTLATPGLSVNIGSNGE